jgi:hypothetical protein
MLTHSRRVWLLALVGFAAIVAALFVQPIAQDPAYHRFVDTRTILGIPNFWNLISNFGYLLVGIVGLVIGRRLSTPALLQGYVTFCLAVIFVAFGSAWYHYSPSTQTLVWDRLPMAVAFMALLAVTLGERVSRKLARAMLWPLVVAGAASVFYWAWTESRGAGDLRPYGLVQFLPIVLMPLLLLMFPGSRSSAQWLWYTFCGYVLAKIAEWFDGPIYDAIGLSGHSMKHFISSVAVLFAVLAMLAMHPADSARESPHRRA